MVSHILLDEKRKLERNGIKVGGWVVWKGTVESGVGRGVRGICYMGVPRVCVEISVKILGNNPQK